MDRYADLKSFVAEWHRPLEPGDGFTEAEIVEVEVRLGFRLPQALRELYRLFGKMGAFYERFGASSDESEEPGILYNTQGLRPIQLLEWDDSEIGLASQDHGEAGETEVGLWFWEDAYNFDSFALKSSDKEMGEVCWFRHDNNGWNTEASLPIADAAVLIAAAGLVVSGRYSAVGTPEPSAWDESRVNGYLFHPGERQYDPHPKLEYLNRITVPAGNPLLAHHDYSVLDGCLCAVENEFIAVLAKSELSLNALIEKHKDLHWHINSTSQAELQGITKNGS